MNSKQQIQLINRLDQTLMVLTFKVCFSAAGQIDIIHPLPHLQRLPLYLEY